MAFNLPNFNLLVDDWTAGHTPAADPPDVVNIPAQIYFGSKSFLDIQPSAPDTWVPPIFIRIPLAFAGIVAKGDIIGRPAGAGDFYKIRWIQSTHIGFPNEYLSLLVEQCTNAGGTPR